MHMKRPSEQVIGALNYERAKKRRHPLHFTQEIDRAVSEANLIRMIHYKEQTCFKDWFSSMEAKSQEHMQRKAQ